MNLAELTDLELAQKVEGIVGEISTENELELEALFRELRQAWQKTTVSYHRGQVHWRTEVP